MLMLKHLCDLGTKSACAVLESVQDEFLKHRIYKKVNLLLDFVDITCVWYSNI